MTKPSLLGQDRTPEQEDQDNKLASIWHKTATQPWHDYMKTVQSNQAKWHEMQGTDDAENQASKQRVRDYLTKYKHLF